MLTTIEIGSCVSVQGELIARLKTGECIVRDGERIYRGRPLRPRSVAAPSGVPSLDVAISA